MNKKEAYEAIKNICNNNSDIRLRVIGETASWNQADFTKMTPIHWKHIGYVGALAFAFKIEKVSADE